MGRCRSGAIAAEPGLRGARRDPAFPNGWSASGPGYEVRLDETNPRSGKVSLRMTRKSPGNFAAATSYLPVKTARGKKVRLSGEIKTEGVKTGYAGLWLRVDGPDGKTLGFDNMSVRIGKDGQEAQDDRGARVYAVEEARD